MKEKEKPPIPWEAKDPKPPVVNGEFKTTNYELNFTAK